MAAAADGQSRPLRRAQARASAPIARSEGQAEVVKLLSGVGDAGVVLEPALVSGRREPARAAVENVDYAGIVSACDILEGDAYSHVVAPVAHEVAGAQDIAEAVVGLGEVGNADAILVPELVSRRREPAGGAVEDIDRAGIGDAPDILEGDAYGQVAASVAVEVARGTGISEVVVCLGGVGDPADVLVPELVSRRREPAAGGAVEDID